MGLIERSGLEGTYRIVVEDLVRPSGHGGGVTNIREFCRYVAEEVLLPSQLWHTKDCDSKSNIAATEPGIHIRYGKSAGIRI